MLGGEKGNNHNCGRLAPKVLMNCPELPMSLAAIRSSASNSTPAEMLHSIGGCSWAATPTRTYAEGGRGAGERQGEFKPLLQLERQRLSKCTETW